MKPNFLRYSDASRRRQRWTMVRVGMESRERQLANRAMAPRVKRDEAPAPIVQEVGR